MEDTTDDLILILTFEFQSIPHYIVITFVSALTEKNNWEPNSNYSNFEVTIDYP